MSDIESNLNHLNEIFGARQEEEEVDPNMLNYVINNIGDPFIQKTLVDEHKEERRLPANFRAMGTLANQIKAKREHLDALWQELRDAEDEKDALMIQMEAVYVNSKRNGFNEREIGDARRKRTIKKPRYSPPPYDLRTRGKGNAVEDPVIFIDEFGRKPKKTARMSTGGRQPRIHSK